MTSRFAYPEPIPCPSDVPGAVELAGTRATFASVRLHRRGGGASIVPVAELPDPVVGTLTGLRAPVQGIPMDGPAIMGILNATPDSFSDGGQFRDTTHIVEAGLHMVSVGADILDIGGESTRPGAGIVPIDHEIARTVPVIEALKRQGAPLLSIDTRKAEVARVAVRAGAGLINDVSAMAYDPLMAATMQQSGLPVCLMHAQGTPDVMQADPRYGDVLLDVFDALAKIRDTAIAAGILKARILLDPGIGFGKTLEHNLRLLRHLPLFHALGCSILIGASRKRFIGTVTGVETAGERLIGSVSVALLAARSGVQVLRVHDVKETKQALTMQAALIGTP